MNILGRTSSSARPTWYTRSLSDPRWNMHGDAYGMWDAQKRIQQAVNGRQASLGDDPPVDLEYGYNKP